MTITITDFDQLDIADALRNAAAYNATGLDARDRQALALLTYAPGLPGATRTLLAALADGAAALPLPTASATRLLDVIGDDDLLGPEPEWSVQEAWLSARKPATGHTGSDPAKLAEVLELLEGEEYVLHPDGDLFGTTRLDQGGMIRFGGNFWGLSHAFEILTDDPELIARLDQAIEKQRAGEAYAQAVVENREHHASWGVALPQ